MKYAIKILLIVFFIVSCSLEILSAPFDTGMSLLQQPNGVTFTGRIWGDEFIYWAETQDGYRFVQSGDEWYYYATLNVQGEYTATTYKVGIDTPPASSYQLARTQARIDEINLQIQQFNAQIELNWQWYAQKQVEADAQSQPSVNLRIGIILIEFQDIKHYKTGPQGVRPNGYYKSDFENMMFSEDYWIGSGIESPHPEGEEVFGSFRDYWYQISRGKLRVGGQVVNPIDHNGVPIWLTATYSRAYYVDTYAGFTILGNEAIQMAIDSGYISTTQGDSNYYDNLAIIYARNPVVGYTSTVGGYPNTNWYILGEQSGAVIYGSNKSFTHIGLHLNSFGVNLGFYDGTLDLNVYNPTDNYRFDLMGLGWFNGPNFKAECPATLAPYFRLKKNWVEAIPIELDTSNFIVEYDYQNPKLYYIDPIGGYRDMHYIFETRKREGFDAYIPEPPGTYQNQPGTLLIWQHNVQFFASGNSQIDKIRLKQADYISSEVTQLNDFFPSASYNNNQSLNDLTLPAASLGNALDEYYPSYIQPAHFALNDIQKLANGNTLISEIKLNHAMIKNQNSGSWQTLSVPVGYNNYTRSYIYPTSISAYKFVNNTYTLVETLTNGLGYWINFPNQNQTLINSGTVIEHLEIPVSTGWNIIGTISDKVARPNVCSQPLGIINNIYKYVDSLGYVLIQLSDSLMPGIGYWTSINRTGSVILDRLAGPCGLQKVNSVPDINLTSLDKFIITDANGNSQSLYVTNIDIDSTLSETEITLPPAFLELDFDSRFVNDEYIKKVSAINGTIDLDILVQAVSFPISLTWELNPANGIQYSFIGDSGLGKISGIESKNGSTLFNSLENKKIELFAIANSNNLTQQLPEDYSLLQCYPNPFNPSTTIKYAIKNDGIVSLKIYNAIGEEIRTLINEFKVAGNYNIEFNAANLPSGVYIYKLQAGEFVSSRKMILLK